MHIFMESVPGGSVTKMLNRVGALWNSKFLVDYTYQVGIFAEEREKSVMII